MSHPSQNLARAVIAGLVRAGVRDFVYCPGSRSAPFAYALDAAVQAGFVRAHVRLDERSAAFLALGIAKAGACDADAQPTPVAVITTSGGAVAELHAAVAEGYHSRIPLIVISADRPAEMRGVGASQTTTQLGIFATHVRGMLDLPADTAPDENLAARLGRMLARAQGLPTGVSGPVHINCALRDPLTPQGGSQTAQPLTLPSYEAATVYAARIEATQWEDVVDPDMRTVIVAGDGADAGAEHWAIDAALPLLAEPSSGLAFSPARIPHQQSLLNSDLAHSVEQIIVTGRPTLSRPVSQLLARPGVRVVVVDSTSEWTDVAGTATCVVPKLAPPHSGVRRNDAWLREWRDLAKQCTGKIEQILQASSLSITHVAQCIWEHDSRDLFLGASNSVRGVDLVGSAGQVRRVASNRGLAGIDGTIASAMGFSIGIGKPVTALMGDLSFFHDAGALAIPEGEEQPDVLIVVADDAGGGIFAGLEHGAPENAPTFERWFATPQATSVEGIATAYGARYTAVDLDGLRALLNEDPRGIVVAHVRCARPHEIADIRRVAEF